MKLRSHRQKENGIKPRKKGVNLGFSNEQTQMEEGVEEMEVIASSPSIAEEENGTTSLQQPETLVINKNYARLIVSEEMTWRQKTRPTSKLHLNIKKILNPNWQKEKLIEIDGFTSEEES